MAGVLKFTPKLIRFGPSSYKLCPKIFSCSTSRNYSIDQWKKNISYSYGASDKPLVGITINEALDHAVDSYGDRLAFVMCHEDIKADYITFKKQVIDLAAMFVELGFKKGDRVAMWSPNCYNWIVVMFAAAKAGIILVTVNPAFQAEEVAYCLKKVGCAGIIAPLEFKTQNYYEMLCSVIPELQNSKSGQLKSSKFPDLKHVIMMNDKPLPGTLLFSDIMKGAGTNSYKLLEDIGKKIQFDEPINIQFTSGTTGSPKAATLSHFNLVNNSIAGSRRLFRGNEITAACVPIPLFHSFGIVSTLMSIFNPVVSVFPSNEFKPVKILQAIDEQKCNLMCLTPTMMIEILNHAAFKNYDVSSLKTVIVSAASCPPELFDELKEKTKINRILIPYGCTETSPGALLPGLHDPLEITTNFVGRALDHVEIKLIDDNNQIVPSNSKGELCVRGHNVFLGYWGDEKKTQEAIDSAGWYHTGDVATMNEEGYVKIVGRKKEMIIRGGENIYPVEIENFLHTHTSIQEAFIVGVPDKRMGEELCAWVQLKKDHNVTEDDLRAFCKGKISHFKIPRYIFFVAEDAFPKTATGKVQKFKMRDESVKMIGL